MSDNLLASLQDADHGDSAVLPGADLPLQVADLENDADTDILLTANTNSDTPTEDIHHVDPAYQDHQNDLAVAAENAQLMDSMDTGFDDHWSDFYSGPGELAAAAEEHARDILSETWTDDSAQLSQVPSGSRRSQGASDKNAGLSKMAPRASCLQGLAFFQLVYLS